MAMTAEAEDRIERYAERMTNHLDRALMSGQMTQKNYDIAMRELARDVELKYERLGR